jgi:hypothetical protein
MARWRSVADIREHWQARYQREGFGGAYAPMSLGCYASTST